MITRKTYVLNYEVVAPSALGLFEENPLHIPMLLTKLIIVLTVQTNPAVGLKQSAITPAVLATFVTLPFRVKVEDVV